MTNFSPMKPGRTRATLSRRRFLQSTTALAAGLTTGVYAAGQAPSNRLRLASVGVGGMGWQDLNSAAGGTGVEVVALCDVDRNNLDRAGQSFDKARRFADYRKMLDKMSREIDAVLISTPDHMHGPIALAAMQLGKHVYVQKPLAHNLRELRAMQDMAAAHPKLVTQMGTQIHSHTAYRTAAAMVREGVIGKVSEAHLWVSRSWAGPPEGRPDRADRVPDTLDWELWQGVAPRRAFAEGHYHPERWRGWKAYGSGTLGDMGCHIFDPAFAALDLGMPTSVVSNGPEHHAETFAPDSDITYTFAATPHTTDRFIFRWTDGNRASRPAAERAQLPDGEQLPAAGLFMVGEKGVMVLQHWGMPRFYRDGQALDIAIESRGSNNHYTEFTDACRGQGKTSTPFSYSARVTEAVLLGTIAGRFRKQPLKWDSPAMTFDHAPANELVERAYAPGRSPLQG